MKPLGEVAVDLPWILPCAGSLVGLTRPDAASVWSDTRFDPGLVLLLARSADADSFANLLHETQVLEKALTWLNQDTRHFVDWNQPGAAHVYQSCTRQALLAQALAAKAGCSTERAFVAALLAPLGWLALCAADVERVPQFVQLARKGSAWQQANWGLEHTAIARRLSRLWRLPAWLAVVIGNLSLHVSIVEKLGADPVLFRVVQLAVALAQHHDSGLNLTLGDEIEGLRIGLGLTTAEIDELSDSLQSPPSKIWDPPARHPYLKDLLRLALDNRKQTEAAWIERLQTELDYLQQALEEHCKSEKERLQTMKLSALAELAAGAGHEINNPLAVISGQAQYLLKQLQSAEDTLAEETSPTALLEGLKAKFAPALQAIVGQTQRIHSVLTDLIHFARPPVAHQQVVSAGALAQEVIATLKDFAHQKQINLLCVEPPANWQLQVDVAQIRTALGGLLRNALEAAPAEGWASLRVENGGGMVQFIVEDNGPGPAPGNLEHMFDPFYSGRSAGRGRGFGLSSAWRLARQQGGDVRYDGRHQNLTRFVLSVPVAENAPSPVVAGFSLRPPGGDLRLAGVDARPLAG